MSPVKYELGFYIPEDGILHSHRRGNLTSYEIPSFNTDNLTGRPYRHSGLDIFGSVICYR
jgi:hypothetical protein